MGRFWRRYSHAYRLWNGCLNDPLISSNPFLSTRDEVERSRLYTIQAVSPRYQGIKSIVVENNSTRANLRTLPLAASSTAAYAAATSSWGRLWSGTLRLIETTSNRSNGS